MAVAYGRMTSGSDFNGRIVVVTGAGSGIGRSSAMLFSRLGAKVHVADLKGESAESVVGEVVARGGRGVSHTVDVTDPEAVEAFCARVYEEEERVDVLHSNAGIGHAANIEQTTVEDWQRVIGVNLLGMAYVVQAFGPRLLKQRGRSSSVDSGAGVVTAAPEAGRAVLDREHRVDGGPRGRAADGALLGVEVRRGGDERVA